MKFSFREYWAADYAANRSNPKGLFLVAHFRVANWCRYSNQSIYYLAVPYLVWYKFFIEWVIGFELPCSTQVGKGLTIHHGTGTVVNSKAKIGERCCLLHQVTIGTLGDGSEAQVPVIGNDVIIGVGAKILGEVNVGDRARIGAATLVLKDVESGAVVVGNPMKRLR